MRCTSQSSWATLSALLTQDDEEVACRGRVLVQDDDRVLGGDDKGFDAIGLDEPAHRAFDEPCVGPPIGVELLQGVVFFKAYHSGLLRKCGSVSAVMGSGG